MAWSPALRRPKSVKRHAFGYREAPKGVGLCSRSPHVAIACCATRLTHVRNGSRAAGRSSITLTVVLGASPESSTCSEPTAVQKPHRYSSAANDSFTLQRTQQQAHGRVSRHLPWGSSASRRNQCGDRYVGLPHRRPPLPGFLTPSAALSHQHLVTMFHVTFAHRLFDLQSFSHSTSRTASRRPLLSCLWGADRCLSTSVVSLASELCSGRASDTRCRGITPRDEPLLSWPFPSSRSTGTLRRAEALPSHAFRRADHMGSTACISGSLTQRPEHGSGESHQPP